MKIWHINTGEPLPLKPEHRPLRSGAFTREMARLGHDVTWWSSTFSHVHKQQLRPGACTELVQGVRFVMLPGTGYKRNVSIARISHQRQFARRFLKAAKLEKDNPDIIWVSIPTLEPAHAAIEFALPRNIPVVIDIRDQWPREVVELAPRILRPLARGILHPMFRSMRFICQNATAITGSAQGHLDYGLRFAGRPRARWDGVYFHGYTESRSSPEELRAAHANWLQSGINPQIPIFSFFGTLGRFFSIDTVIDAARLINCRYPDKKYQIVLGGVGSQLDTWKRRAADVPNIFFPGWCGQAQMQSMFDMSTMGLAPYSPSSVSETLPNKPMEFCAAGLGVISTLGGEFETLGRQHDIAWQYTHDDVQTLVELLLRAIEHPDSCKRMGERAREVFNKHFRAETIATQMCADFEGIVEQTRRERLRNQQSSPLIDAASRAA